MTRREAVPAVIAAVAITVITTVSALLAPDTWERPVVAMLIMWGGFITWAAGFVGGTRRSR